MSNFEITKRIAGLLEARDLAGFQAMVADDFRAKGGSQELNKQQSLAFLQILFTAFPDHRFGFTDFEEDGDLVHCAGEETGTQMGTPEQSEGGEGPDISHCLKEDQEFATIK